MKKKSACRTSFFMLNYIHLYSITEFLMKNGEADMLYFIANETARTGKGEGRRPPFFYNKAYKSNLHFKLMKKYQIKKHKLK